MTNASTTPPWERPSKWCNSTVIKHDSIMTADELASYLQVPSGVVFELIRHEGLPVIYLSEQTYMRFLRESVTTWLKDQETKCCTGLDALRMGDQDFEEIVASSADGDLEEDDSADEEKSNQSEQVPRLSIFKGER